MTFLDPRMWLAGIGIASVMFFAGYATRWQGDSARQAKADIGAIKADVKKQNVAVQELEVKREERKKTSRAIQADYRRTVADPVYGRDCFDDEGLATANKALSGH